MHANPGNLWAAVLYLDMGVDPSSQADARDTFYVEDPRFPVTAMHNTDFRMKDFNGQLQTYMVDLKLREGNLVVFPVWLRHGVRPYQGIRKRISVTLNLDARPKSHEATY